MTFNSFSINEGGGVLSLNGSPVAHCVKQVCPGDDADLRRVLDQTAADEVRSLSRARTELLFWCLLNDGGCNCFPRGHNVNAAKPVCRAGAELYWPLDG